MLIYRLPDPELLSAEDLTEELLLALEGKEHRCEYEGTVPVPDEWGGTAGWLQGSEYDNETALPLKQGCFFVAIV